MNGKRTSFQSSTTQMCVEFKKDLDDMHAQDDHAEGISSAVDIQFLVRSLDLG